MPIASELPWDRPGWRAAAATWIGRALTDHGHGDLQSIVDVNIRPWAAVLKATTEQRAFFFKAPVPGLAYEPPILQLLADLRPALVPTIVAVEPGRGWLLLADAGPPIRENIDTPGGTDLLEPIVVAYAELQQAAAPAVPRLVANESFGAVFDLVPDHRLSSLPEVCARLVADDDALRAGQPGGLTKEEGAWLRAYRPDFAAACRRLDDYGLPASIDHADLHDNNIFGHGERFVIGDWGDASLNHPFVSLPVTLWSLASRLKVPVEHPALARLRDAYLGAWAAFGSPRDLRRAYDLAVPLASLGRALTWWRLRRRWPPGPRAEFASYIPYWLRDFRAAVTKINK